MKISLIGYPSEKDWIECKRRALITVGKKSVITPPDSEWKRKMLRSRHSPCRYLRYSFMLEGVPYYVAMHLRTHVHDCPNGDEFDVLIKTQRNDRQDKYDRTKAPQDAPVNMIIDASAEQVMNLANKRLCMLVSPETREVVREMCRIAEEVTPEFEGLLIPNCEWHNGKCYEMFPCGRWDA